MNKIRTVLGDIDSAKVGQTYPHEHLFTIHPSDDKTLTISDDEKTTKEVITFKKIGGNTIIDGTPADLGRNLRSLKKISKDSKVNIVASTGNYLFDFMSEKENQMTEEELADHYISEVLRGEEGTGIKVGQIKVAVSLRFIHEQERKQLEAAAKAQKRTNAPIWIHHGGILGVEIANILKNAGADLSKVILGHIDRNPDFYDHLEILKTGMNVSVDNLARVTRYPVQTNIDVIKNVIDHGYIDKLFISADFGRTSYYEAYGGGPGLRYIFDSFYPRMIDQLKLNSNEIEMLKNKNVEMVYGQF